MNEHQDTPRTPATDSPATGPFGVVHDDSREDTVRIAVAAFEGWNDAGSAASDTVEALEQALDARELFTLGDDEYYDYQYARPQQVRSASGEISIVWPRTTASVARVPGTNVELILVRGWEPSYRWRQFCASLLERLSEVQTDFAIVLGALLADVPHTRPIPVTTSTSAPALQQALGISDSDYEGPTGITGVLSHLAGAQGVPTVSLWGAIPHYVGQAPSPKAQLALLGRLEEILGIALPHRSVDEDAQAWERGVDDLMEEDPEVRDYVTRLEEAKDTTDLPEASGDAIAQEFERFLRRRGDA